MTDYFLDKGAERTNEENNTKEMDSTGRDGIWVLFEICPFCYLEFSAPVICVVPIKRTRLRPSCSIWGTNRNEPAKYCDTIISVFHHIGFSRSIRKRVGRNPLRTENLRILLWDKICPRPKKSKKWCNGVCFVTGLARTASRMTGDAHQPACALRDHIERGEVLRRTKRTRGQ